MHLRVWWAERKETFLTHGREAGSGIVIGASSDHTDSLVIRTDDGRIFSLDPDDVSKSKWVSHPDDGENG